MCRFSDSIFVNSKDFESRGSSLRGFMLGLVWLNTHKNLLKYEENLSFCLYGAAAFGVL